MSFWSISIRKIVLLQVKIFWPCVRAQIPRAICSTDDRVRMGSSTKKIHCAGFRQGVIDCLEQPLDVQALKFALDAAYRRADPDRELAAAQKLVTSSHVEGLLGNSKPMARVNDVIRKVAGVFTSVMVTGESGTGKEVVARAIHNLSQRAPTSHSLLSLPTHFLSR